MAIGMADIGLALAAFGAGVLNAVAGGGTFLTLPALIFAGVPPVAANATSAVAVLPGYIGGALGFRHEIAQTQPRLLVSMTAATVIGGLAGAWLLLLTPDKAFAGIVPWLLLFATVLFAFSGKKRHLEIDSQTHRLKWGKIPAVCATAAYGGYFNGGLGILLMAVLSFARVGNLNVVNGLKNYISALLSLISVGVFAAADIVQWREATVMMGFSLLGGFFGARLAKFLPAKVVYVAVILTGITMCILFQVKVT